MSGINFVVFIIIGYVTTAISRGRRVGGRTLRVLLRRSHANPDRCGVLRLAVLNLLWFAAALRTTLRMRGRTVGARRRPPPGSGRRAVLPPYHVGAALAYSIAGSGNSAFISGLNDFTWACVVLTSFPRAMLIMAGTFGLWRPADLERALPAGSQLSCSSCWAHHVVERWILDTGRRLFTFVSPIIASSGSCREPVY